MKHTTTKLNHISTEAGRKWGYKEQTPTLTTGGPWTSEWHKPDVVSLRVSDGRAETEAVEKAPHLQTMKLRLLYNLHQVMGQVIPELTLSPSHHCIQRNVSQFSFLNFEMKPLIFFIVMWKTISWILRRFTFIHKLLVSCLCSYHYNFFCREVSSPLRLIRRLLGVGTDFWEPII